MGTFIIVSCHVFITIFNQIEVVLNKKMSQETRSALQGEGFCHNIQIGNSSEETHVHYHSLFLDHQFYRSDNFFYFHV